MADRPILVTKNDLRRAGTSTPGVARFEAFADEHVWFGRVENAPHQASDWHVHPGHDTYAYSIRGRFFVDFGPGGRDRSRTVLTHARQAPCAVSPQMMCGQGDIEDFSYESIYLKCDRPQFISQ